MAMKVVRQARLELSGGSTPDQLRPLASIRAMELEISIYCPLFQVQAHKFLRYASYLSWVTAVHQRPETPSRVLRNHNHVDAKKTRSLPPSMPVVFELDLPNFGPPPPRCRRSLDD